MLVHLERELKLRSDTVSAAHKNRLLDIQSRKVEHASERPDISHNPGTCGRSNMRLDPAHDLVTGFKIDAGLFITYCHNDIFDLISIPT